MADRAFIKSLDNAPCHIDYVSHKLYVNFISYKKIRLVNKQQMKGISTIDKNHANKPSLIRQFSPTTKLVS